VADISIDWSTKVIFVPKAYTTLITPPPPQEIRRLDTDQFRKDLKALEASPIGMSFLDTHRHNTTVEVGGVILARVIEIINGYTVTFEDGLYSVNLVGSNNNIADVTNVNQVSIRSANSAGLQDLSSLQAASFQGVITIDVINGVPGTLFPIGTEGQPVNNLVDALAISVMRGIKTFRVVGTLVIDIDVTGYTLKGARSFLTDILVLTGTNTDGSRLEDLTVTGAQDGSFFYERCLITGLTGCAGVARECGFDLVQCTIHDDETFVAADCISGVPGQGSPSISLGTNSTIQLRRYSGGMRLVNVDASNDGTIGLTEGHLILDASCTGGTLTLRGVGQYTRQDGGAVTVNELGFVSDPSGKLRRRLNLAEEADGVLREIE